MSLQDKLDAFKAEFEGKKAPPEVVAIFHRSTAELIASGQAARALKVGDRAPAFRLPDTEGATVTSAELLANGPAGCHLLPRRVVPVLQYGFASD